MPTAARAAGTAPAGRPAATAAPRLEAARGGAAQPVAAVGQRRWRTVMQQQYCGGAERRAKPWRRAVSGLRWDEKQHAVTGGRTRTAGLRRGGAEQ